MAKSIFFTAACGIANLATGLISEAPYFYNTERPLIMGHRGSLTHYPEHTIAGYADAYFMGTDFIELDVQITKDGYQITNHDACLKESTNIEQFASYPSYADRMVSIHIGHTQYTDDWLINDFNLQEINMLARRQRYNYRSQWLDGIFRVQTLDNVIQLVQMLNSDEGRKLNADVMPGLYIEIKDYDFYDGRGINSAKKLIDLLATYNLDTVAGTLAEGIPIVIQSYHKEALLYVAGVSDLPLIQLMRYDMTEYALNTLEDIGKYAHGVGPNADWVFKGMPEDPFFNFVNKAHANDLAVHPYTFREDNLKYSPEPRDPKTELQMYVDAGVDGIFTETPHSTYDMFLFTGTNANFPTAAILS